MADRPPATGRHLVVRVARGRRWIRIIHVITFPPLLLWPNGIRDSFSNNINKDHCRLKWTSIPLYLVTTVALRPLPASIDQTKTAITIPTNWIWRQAPYTVATQKDITLLSISTAV